MSCRNKFRWPIILAACAAGLALALLLIPAAAEAQCAMCKTAVQAGGDQSQRTMRTAMLVLLIPPVTIFCSIFVVAYKNRNRAGREADGEGRDGGR